MVQATYNDQILLPCSGFIADKCRPWPLGHQTESIALDSINVYIVCIQWQINGGADRPRHGWHAILNQKVRTYYIYKPSCSLQLQLYPASQIRLTPCQSNSGFKSSVIAAVISKDRFLHIKPPLPLFSYCCCCWAGKDTFLLKPASQARNSHSQVFCLSRLLSIFA